MNKQKEVIKAFGNDREKVLTKNEIFASVPFSYHCNEDKHFGEILSRMVNNNSLERVSKGKYKLGTGNKNKTEPVSENQTKLF